MPLFGASWSWTWFSWQYLESKANNIGKSQITTSSLEKKKNKKPFGFILRAPGKSIDVLFRTCGIVIGSAWALLIELSESLLSWNVEQSGGSTYACGMTIPQL